MSNGRFSCLPPEKLAPLLAGLLPIEGAEVRQLEEHLTTCPRCGRLADKAKDENDPLLAALARKARPDPEPEAVTRLVSRLKSYFAPVPRPPADRHVNGEGESETLNFLAPPQGADEIGRLGSYRVLEVLGRGGMGIVFRAEETELKRSVALKVLKRSFSAQGAAGEFILREAQAAARLEHPHIVPIYRVGMEPVPFLSMQLLKGESLDQRLKRQHTLPALQVLRIGRQVSEALAYAHDQGFIHRDIKPANIWLEALSTDSDPSSPYERVKLLDFGLALPAGDSCERMGGTPAYMAPEQVDGATDSRSDLYSLGCVLYQACTGKLPTADDGDPSVLAGLIKQAPKPPHLANPNVPRALSILITKLLAKDPNGRFQSARDVVHSLDAVEHALVPQTEVRYRVAWLAALGGVMTALLVAVVLYVVLRPAGGPDTKAPLPTQNEDASGKPEHQEKIVLQPNTRKVLVGEIYREGQEDWYEVEVAEAGFFKVEIGRLTEKLDNILQLHDRDRVLIGTADNLRRPRLAKIVCEVNGGDIFQIKVAAAKNGTGQYHLLVSHSHSLWPGQGDYLMTPGKQVAK